jgi:hypothetical protein
VTVADDARVALFLADFANADAIAKFNIVGGGWQVTGRLPTGMTSPMVVVALIEVPSSHYGEQLAWGLSLHNEAGDLVSLPGPSGEAQAMRVQQLAKIEKPNIPGVIVPENFLPSRIQLMLSFPGGLLLTPGPYRWRLEIDGNQLPKWDLAFVVAGPPPQPVIG